MLKVAPEGTAVYVVFSGDTAIAAYPPQERPYAQLLEHAELSKRFRPEDKPARQSWLGHRSRSRELS